MGVLNMQMGQKAAVRNIASHSKVAPRDQDSQQLRSSASSNWTDDTVGDEPPTTFLERHLDTLAALDDEEEDTATPEQQWFDIAMSVCIIANVVWMSIEIDWGPKQGTPVSERVGWMVGSTLFLIVFWFEVCVRLYVERRNWKYKRWNWFDVFVALLGTLDVWVLTFIEGKLGSLQALSTLRLARLIRLVRMVKLVKNLQGLYVMVMAFLHALSSMFFLGVILFFGILIYAIFATMLIGQSETFRDVVINGDKIEKRFGKVYRSMYSLFELMTLEGWEAVARPLVEAAPWCFFFLASFIMIFTYGILNMVVATVVEKTMEQTSLMKELDEKKEIRRMSEEVIELTEFFKEFDEDQDGNLTKEEFEATFDKNPVMVEALHQMGVPTKDPHELFRVLDWRGKKAITVNEFINGIGKIRHKTICPWDSIATYSATKCVERDVAELEARVSASRAEELSWRAGIEARLDEQASLLRAQNAMLQEIVRGCVPAAQAEAGPRCTDDTDERRPSLS